jgi:hypothetical protein
MVDPCCANWEPWPPVGAENGVRGTFERSDEPGHEVGRLILALRMYLGTLQRVVEAQQRRRRQWGVKACYILQNCLIWQ